MILRRSNQSYRSLFRFILILSNTYVWTSLLRAPFRFFPSPKAQELARFPPSFKKMMPTLGGRHELRGSAVHRLKVPEVDVVNTPHDATIAARGLQDACDATQPIEIVSPALSNLEGCYFITDSATDTLYFSTNVASAVGVIENQNGVRSERDQIIGS